MRPVLFVLGGAVALAIAGCGTTETAKNAEAATVSIDSPLVGRWESVAFEGADTPPGLRAVEITFGADGTFVTVARGVENDKQHEQVQKGAYRISGRTFAVQIPNRLPPPPTPFRFEEGGRVLILEDPSLDSSIRFKRIGD